MTDFSKMDGQQICQWLSEHGVKFDPWYSKSYIPDPYNPSELCPGEILVWNLPACAWAARMWCLVNRKTSDYWQAVYECVKERQGQKYAGHWIDDMIELDWLTAAARVIDREGKE